MRFSYHAFLAACLWLALVALCVQSLPSEAGESAAESAAKPAGGRANFRPSKLFDFANFKKMFKKNYSGFREELVRKKYFLSRAFRAYISSIKYKYRKSTFYLAINEMSDWTPKEIKMSFNKVLTANIKRKLQELGRRAAQKFESDLPEALPEDADEAEATLKQMAELEAARAAAEDDADVRHLPAEALIHANEEVEAGRKLNKSVASNNPHYEPVELASYGLVDEQADITFYEVRPSRRLTSWCSSLFAETGAETSSRARRGRQSPTRGLADEVFMDLRTTSDCFLPPRHQGYCGACYAFSTISAIEWLYCKQTGDLIPFSEQYMIDCGTAFAAGINGCNGGDQQASMRFVANFGVELAQNYPYFMRQNECPYDVNTDLRTTGYIRVDYEGATEVPMQVWPWYLNESPILAAMSWEEEYLEYGGGVFGWGCSQQDSSHAVVIVGHGREDGHQYWLIRNSLGTSWGDGGYGKLAKRANCFDPQAGYVVATRDGIKRRVDISLNDNNDPFTVNSFVRQLRRG